MLINGEAWTLGNKREPDGDDKMMLPGERPSSEKTSVAEVGATKETERPEVDSTPERSHGLKYCVFENATAAGFM